MATVFQLLGLALLAIWAALVFGYASAFLVVALACFVIGLALSDVKLKLPKMKRRAE